tara:strand:- start:44 stop:622 length:579 start_codon:yes stop_codon:yes gene_type:complete
MSELNFTHSNGNKVKLTTPGTLAANRTLTLPGNANGTIVTSESPASGSVIQVTASVITSANTFNNSHINQYNDTVMTASITPKFATSTLIVNFQFGLLLRDNGNSAALGYGVKRNGTRVISSNSNPHEQFTSGSGSPLTGFRTTYTYVDTTHNSTSQQTYLLEAFLRNYSNMVAEFNTRSETANVVIYEVAA